MRELDKKSISPNDYEYAMYIASMESTDVKKMTFATLRETGGYYVDKTGLIIDILDSNPFGVYLLTRPHGFGKTVNISMLDSFFNIAHKDNTWFNGLEISRFKEHEVYENAFPTIWLDLEIKNVKDFEDYLEKMREALKDAFEPHRYLLEWQELSGTMKSLFEIFESKTTPLNTDMLKFSINNLSEALTRYHGKTPVILIDEYDCAVSTTIEAGLRKKIIAFLTRFLYACIKGNPNKQMTFITGTIHFAHESIPSIENDIFSEKYADRFGFTEGEVSAALKAFESSDKLDIVKKWCGGYRFGCTEIYNPRNMMRFISWKRTEIPDLIDREALVEDLLESNTAEKCADLTRLIQGDSIESDLVDSFPYDVARRSNEPPYRRMAMSGYLDAIPSKKNDIYGEELFELSIPNEWMKMLVGRLVESCIRRT